MKQNLIYPIACLLLLLQAGAPASEQMPPNAVAGWKGKPPPQLLEEIDCKKGFSQTVRFAKPAVSFSGYILQDIDLEGCNLQYTDFSHALLINVNLSSANLIGSSFINADLQNVKFDGAWLCGTKLDLTSAQNVTMEQAVINDTTWFSPSTHKNARDKPSFSGTIHYTKKDGISDGEKSQCLERGAHRGEHRGAKRTPTVDARCGGARGCGR